MKRTLLICCITFLTQNAFAITIIMYDEHNQMTYQHSYLPMSSASSNTSQEPQNSIDEQEQVDFAVTSTKEKFVIGVWPHGFFSAFLGVIGNLLWADRNDKTPLVYWGPQSLYYQSGGYNGSTNVWEYYFEPVSDMQYREGDAIHDDYKAPDKSEVPYHQHHSRDYRRLINDIISKYICIKPVVQEKIEAFYAEKMANQKVVGIHLRGTDKHWEILLPKPDRLIREANSIAQQIGATTFLVATDEKKLLAMAQRSLNGTVIFYEAQRSNNHHPVHTQHNNQKAHIGEEVLIEAQLLSRCDWFVCSYSNVAYAAYFFNPELQESFIRWHKDKQVAKLGAIIACALNRTTREYKLFKRVCKAS
jgi:hypothetical protein